MSIVYYEPEGTRTSSDTRILRDSYVKVNRNKGVNMQLVLQESGRSQARENITGILLSLSMIVATGNHGDYPNRLNSYSHETLEYCTSTCLSTSCSWSMSGPAGSSPLRIVF